MFDFIVNNPIASAVVTAGIIAIVGIAYRSICKGFKQLKDLLSTHEQDHKDIKQALYSSNETDMLLLKAKIQDIHGRMVAKGSLGKKDKELANDIYDRYHKMGGNGYIRVLLSEINNWEAIHDK